MKINIQTKLKSFFESHKIDNSTIKQKKKTNNGEKFEIQQCLYTTTIFFVNFPLRFFK